MKDLELHLDMDGVMADFESAVEEVAGKPISELSREEVHRIADEPGFFANLKPLPRFKEIISFALDHGIPICINSSTGSRDPERVEEEKLVFLSMHVKGVPIDNHYFVSSSAMKADFAHPGAILIDDREKCVVPFREAGGYAILHKDVDTTLQELKEIVYGVLRV